MIACLVVGLLRRNSRDMNVTHIVLGVLTSVKGLHNSGTGTFSASKLRDEDVHHCCSTFVV